MHEANCRCGACVMVRAYLSGGATDHPVCCVCPLCAAPRIFQRLAEHSEEMNNFGRMYERVLARQKMVGTGPMRSSTAWWMFTDGANQAWGLSTGQGPNPFYGRGEIDPIEPITPTEKLPPDAHDAIETFDLLHDLGIPIRKDNP